MGTTIRLVDYLSKGKPFLIPNYQRGYVWGKKRVGEKDSVSNLVDDLLTRYNNGMPVFLQGFTVTEKADEIVLIDGQQRTTCMYLLLKWLGYTGTFKLKYEIRKVSQDYLECIDTNDFTEDNREQYQDIFFFKKTLRIIQEKLSNVDKQLFMTYLLENVHFLYINVPEEHAIKVFTMMNGSKAKMLQEEIIKAEILRLASLNTSSQPELAEEWEMNLLRSRYAREWDKWLHWWNRDDVQKIYLCKNTMGLLISSYFKQRKGEDFSFENFKKKCLSQSTELEAKQTFDGLRRLQKRYEDAFDQPETHNMIGAILRIFDLENRKKFIEYYFVDDNRDTLKDYYLLAFIGMTHDEILQKNKEKFTLKYENTLTAINDDYLYLSENKESAFRLLLRLNVDQDTKLGRKFDFNIWNKRSLEHIFAKSNVIHQENGKWYDGNDKEYVDTNGKKEVLKREDICFNNYSTTEHSIGNLVLLDKDDNSKFNNSEFDEKKVMFFSPRHDYMFKSRILLHTICVFAEKKDWNGESIAMNKLDTIQNFKNEYSELRNNYGYEE